RGVPRVQSRRRDDAQPGVGPADDAGGPGAQHHGAAQDHLGRGRRRKSLPARRRRRAPARLVANGDVLTVRSTGQARAELVEARARGIRLILFDVDGVLTDGKLLLHADGSESKQFDIKDGTAIVWSQRCGLTVGLLSARASASTTQRAAQLGIALVHQGVASKLDTFERILEDQGIDAEQVAYMGDDVLDLPVLSRAGLAAGAA